MSCKQICALLLVVCTLAPMVLARPDDGETVTVPGPGLAYGGLPYGSMSGNVAAFSKRLAPSNGQVVNFGGYRPNPNVHFGAIEQFL